MHALPGIVDGARKTSQVGRWVRGSARGKLFIFSSSPMLEATSSENQCMSVAPSVVYHVGIFSSYRLQSVHKLVHRCWITVSILKSHRRNRDCYCYSSLRLDIITFFLNVLPCAPKKQARIVTWCLFNC